MPKNQRDDHLGDSRVFCMAPWTHLHVIPTGEIFPCCWSAHESGNSIGNLRDGDTLESAWNSPSMRRLRRKMLDGRGATACERCYRVEALGLEGSFRRSVNSSFAHHYPLVKATRADGGVDELNLPYLDIRSSNLCNFKCRICTPKFSTRWHRDAVALGQADASSPALISATVDPESLWSHIEPHIHQLEKVHFAGGEPLIMENHYQILERLLELGRTSVVLSYNTNLSRLRYRHFDVIEMWNQFENVIVHASLDGSGDRGDLMRSGQKWEDIVRNRERMLSECSHVSFAVHSTVGLMNVFHMPHFFREWVELGLAAPNEFIFNILFEPEHYNVRALPIDMKESVVQEYESFMEGYLGDLGDLGVVARQQFQAVLKYMNGGDLEALPRLRSVTAALDSLRSESFSSVFPELAPLLKPSEDEVAQPGPNRSVQLFETAQSKRREGNVPGALADFAEAVELAAVEALEHIDRALENDGELTALVGPPPYPEQSDLFVQPAFGYYLRAMARHATGDSEGALADSRRVPESGPLALAARQLQAKLEGSTNEG